MSILVYVIYMHIIGSAPVAKCKPEFLNVNEHFSLAFICSSLSYEIGGIIGDDDKTALMHLIRVAVFFLCFPSPWPHKTGSVGRNKKKEKKSVYLCTIKAICVYM